MRTLTGVAAVAAACAGLASAQLNIAVNENATLYRLTSPFLNFNVDTGSVYNGFNWRDPVLINLVYALNNGDVIIRIGGTAADYAFYIPDSPTSKGTNPVRNGQSETIYNNQLFDDLFYFTSQTHASILFDFNGLAFRNSTFPDGSQGPWDPNGNATAILSYLNGKYGGAITNWAWSLTNEPNLWKPEVANYTQLGVDALTLAQTLKAYKVGSQVYGSSFGSLAIEPVLAFLNGSRGNVAGVTVHNYPLARNCDVPSYLNRSFIDRLGVQLVELVQARDAAGHKNTPLVLEEVAGSYGGGCVNITDRFLSGFSYLSTIGTVAASGFGRMHRQDLAGWSFTGGMSNYQLAGPPGWTDGSDLLTPHADWYTSVLFKQLTTSVILPLNMSAPSDPSLLSQVSAHAWCSGAAWWDAQALVVSWTNPTGVDVTVNFSSVMIPAVPRSEYTLTSSSSAYYQSQERVAAGKAFTTSSPQDPPASLQDDVVYMNGALLQTDSNGVLPWPNGAVGAGKSVTDPSVPLVFPPYSYGFIQFPGSKPKGC